MRGISGFLFLLGISMFLNAAGGNWASGRGHGATAVVLDIVIGLAFWIASFLLWRFAEFRDRQRAGVAALREARSARRFQETGERYLATYEEFSVEPPERVHEALRLHVFTRGFSAPDRDEGRVIASAGLRGFSWRHAEGHEFTCVSQDDADALAAFAHVGSLDGAHLLAVARKYANVDALGDLPIGRGAMGIDFLAQGCELACGDLEEQCPGAAPKELRNAFYLGVALYDVVLTLMDDAEPAEHATTSQVDANRR